MGFLDAVGTAIFGKDKREKRIREALASQDARLTPLLDQMGAASRGEGPSVAQEQLRQALSHSAAQMHGAAAGARAGQSQALARRNAMQMGQALQGQVAGQGALLRLQEQMQARAALGGMLQNLRGQNVNAYGGLNQHQTNAERGAGLLIGTAQAVAKAKTGGQAG